MHDSKCSRMGTKGAIAERSIRNIVRLDIFRAIIFAVYAIVYGTCK